jgi:hypothetical protein
LSGLLVTDPDPDGLTFTLNVYWFCVKFAVTLFGPLIVTFDGFELPERSPDQLPKLYPALAVAEIETTWPLSYQFIPEGITLPTPDGLTEVVRVYWVPNVAVYVVLDEGAVIVWLCPPPSLHEE